MNVELKFSSPLSLMVNALNMSHDLHDKSDKYDEPTDNITDKDKKRLYRVVNKLKHKSIAEMAVYWFDIDGISRACLQELARHRTARLTVKSSRYTLKELKECNPSDYMRFLVPVNDRTNLINMEQLDILRDKLNEGLSNDQAKYMLPEAFKTRLQWQIDGRNLQNFLELRSSKDALWEIRQLAREIYTALPSDHQYLYEEYMKDN